MRENYIIPHINPFLPGSAIWWKEEDMNEKTQETRLSCKNCTYQEKGNAICGVVRMLCHRYPPKALDDGGRLFPPVSSYDICGEHKLRVEK